MYCVLTNMSHKVFELRGLHRPASVFVEGTEGESNLVVVGIGTEDFIF